LRSSSKRFSKEQEKVEIFHFKALFGKVFNTSDATEKKELRSHKTEFCLLSSLGKSH